MSFPIKEFQAGRFASLIIGIIVAYVLAWLSGWLGPMIFGYNLFTGNWFGAIISGIWQLITGPTMGIPTTVFVLGGGLLIYILFLRFSVKPGWYFGGLVLYAAMQYILGLLLILGFYIKLP